MFSNVDEDCSRTNQMGTDTQFLKFEAHLFVRIVPELLFLTIILVFSKVSVGSRPSKQSQ